MPGTAQIAMSADFLSAFAHLPRPQQRSVRTLITKFNANPTSTGLNYERVHGARDSGMRSLRIDGGYRAIVLKPATGNVHLLLWADKHDEAYAWAERHECRINPETGALQVYEPQSTAPEEAASSAAEPSPRAFDGLRDRELLRLGVPVAMLPEVREVRSEPDLDDVQARLPQEAYEALFLLLAGESYENLVLQREAPSAPVDTDDFSAALRNFDSRARFAIAHDQMELEAMLNAPLERWRVFLHPSQRRLVERQWSGPVRVLGGAGTGKTVVAMHRARWLARQLVGRAEDGGGILFTTFTRNLAVDIEANLRLICTPKEMARIEVTSLDRWVQAFLQGQRYDFRIQYGRDKESWERALDVKEAGLEFPDAFYKDEWEQVVMARGVTTAEEYRRVSRLGRGTPLSRAARLKVWRVFEEYRAQLAERGLKEVDDAYRDTASILDAGQAALNIRAVIVDEAQDMSEQAFRLLRRLTEETPDDLFLVGDAHQRIYGRARVVLSRCGIRVVGRSRKLRLNYRTTEETRGWAARLLHGRPIDDLDGGEDDDRVRSLTHDPEPLIRHFDSREKQADGVVRYLKRLRERGQLLRSVCVAAPVKSELDALEKTLRNHDLAVFQLGPDTLDDGTKEGVRLATMHRVKGLEFDRVVIASVNDGLVPHRRAYAGAGDAAELAKAETKERALLHVAATRAKKELLVLSYGRPSPFLA
jgi:superfamily I DNA/RNA helicase